MVQPRQNKSIWKSTTCVCLAAACLFGSAGVSVALPKCVGNYNNGTWTNCVGALAFPDGAIYFGEFHKNKFHGKGTIVSPLRGTVACKFVNGKVKGRCILKKPEAI